MGKRIFLLVSTLVWLPYGIYCFFAPGFLAGAAGVAALSPTGRTELRAMYGGLQAGIGWVGTVPEQRGHGYAEAVTWAAVREGFRRGAAFANLQASPMGRPIYERMGFITPTEYRVLFGAP